MLVTTDGGGTWAREASGTGGAVRFVTPHEGWVAGGPGGGYLYSTRDGGKNWQQVSLKAPPETGPAIYPQYDLPVFADTKHGFLPGDV